MNYHAVHFFVLVVTITAPAAKGGCDVEFTSFKTSPCGQNKFIRMNCTDAQFDDECRLIATCSLRTKGKITSGEMKFNGSLGSIPFKKEDDNICSLLKDDRTNAMMRTVIKKPGQFFQSCDDNWNSNGTSEYIFPIPERAQRILPSVKGELKGRLSILKINGVKRRKFCQDFQGKLQ